MSANPVSNFPTKVGIVGVILVTVLTIALATWFMPSSNDPDPNGPYKSVIYPANLRSIANSCGDIYLYDPKPGDYGIIPDTIIEQDAPVPEGPMTVPVYGYMSPDLITRDQLHYYDTGQYGTPTRAQLLRAMYDYGSTVIWYDTLKVPASTLAQIKEYVATHYNVVAIPWTGKILPQGRMLAFSAWGVSQSCNTWSPTTFEEFEQFVTDHPVARPSEIPTAKLNKSGGLFLIDPNHIYTQE